MSVWGDGRDQGSRQIRAFSLSLFQTPSTNLKKKKKTEACSFSGETKDSSGHSKSDIDDVVKREGYLLKELSWV